MARSYGNTYAQLKPAKLPKTCLTAIGRLVRACAEIEDLVDLCIATLAEISETKATILIGRTAVTRRIEIAEQLASIRTDKALAVRKGAFNEQYYDIIDCRNAVAHGTLLGKDSNGNFAFPTASTAKPQDQKAMRYVFGYTAEQIIKFAERAE